MNCPKCGRENPDGAQKCNSCGCVLTTNSKKGASPHPRRSVPAVASFVLAIFSVAFILGGWGPLGLLFSIILAILAIVFGIISLVKISKSEGRLKGKGLAIAGIYTPLCIILIFLFIQPLIHKRPYSRNIRQKAQFHSIGIAMDLFNAEWDGYPPSEALDGANNPYCGAMKLAEAMVGKDMCGFNPDSDFTASNPGLDPLYNPDTLIGRKQYLKLEGANVETIGRLYNAQTAFDPCEVVLCDVYAHRTASGERVGMPILYYKANISKTKHDLYNPDNPENIYNYKDNHALLGLGVPRKPGQKHPLFVNPKIFYEMTKNHKVAIQSMPYRADSYILISAGKDGLFGTADDVVNFPK